MVTCLFLLGMDLAYSNIFDITDRAIKNPGIGMTNLDYTNWTVVSIIKSNLKTLFKLPNS